MNPRPAASLAPSPGPVASPIGTVLPNTFVIGAAKSGTTALAEALASHPEICMAARKESHYYLFDERPQFAGPGDDQWLARYSVTDAEEFASLFDHYSGEPVVAEASVYYLYRLEAIERIERERPGSRYIVLLRDPALRARSGYRHMVRDGRETETFEAALAAEADRINAGWEYGWHYLAVSEYADQLRALFDLVGRERVHVSFYEDFDADPVTVQRRIAEFLGIDPEHVRAHVPRVNVSGVPRSKTLYRLLDRPRSYLPRGMVDRLSRARGLRKARAWILERNLRARETAPEARPRPTSDDGGLRLAREHLADQRDAVAAVLGVDPPWT